jgi:hypothetical protein
MVNVDRDETARAPSVQDLIAQNGTKKYRKEMTMDAARTRMRKRSS